MATEIERKFLVKGEFKSLSNKSYRIKQGYIPSSEGRSVRIRLKDQQAFITIKGASNESGLSRFEWEKEISVSEAEELFSVCDPNMIDKTRYIVEYKGHIFEVDEFYEANEGLIVAEVELQSETEIFDIPTWLGKEVTGDKRYYNISLINNPFANWKDKV